MTDSTPPPNAWEAHLIRLLQSAPVDADEATRRAWLEQLTPEERQAIEDLAAAWLDDQLRGILPAGGLHGHHVHLHLPDEDDAP